MKKTLLATTAVLGLAAAPGIAHATLLYDIYTNVNAVTFPAALQATAAGFAVAASQASVTAGAIHITGIGTNDTLNLNSGPTNTLGTFLSTASFTQTLGPPFAGLVMSNAANTNTTAIHITETYNGTPIPLTSQLIHDDGATIPDAFTNPGMVSGCGTPGPQSVGPGETCTFPTGPGNHTINLFYEESFGAPAVLQVTLPAEVPEPATLALLGSALVGFGVWRRRRRTS